MDEYLLIDGYNIIFAWDELNELASADLNAARIALQEELCNYQGFKKINVIVVYDGHKVKDNKGSNMPYYNIDIVFTKEAQTADTYIETVSKQLAKNAKVTVATSDRIEQMIIIGDGAFRLSASDLKAELEATKQLMKEKHIEKLPSQQNMLFDHASKELAALLEKMRLTSD